MQNEGVANRATLEYTPYCGGLTMQQAEPCTRVLIYAATDGSGKTKQFPWTHAMPAPSRIITWRKHTTYRLVASIEQVAA